MSDKVEFKEIVYCNLTIIFKTKTYLIKKVVYKNDGKLFYEKKHLSPLNINEPVKIINIDIISRLGFENKAIGYTEVKKNEEIRNKITGAYE
jgi:hypothetical protein